MRPASEESRHSVNISKPMVSDTNALKPGHRLYGSPLLSPGEAMGTWLYRVAAYHRIDPAQLLRTLKLRRALHDLDFGAPFNMQTAVAIASLTLNPLEAILAASSPPMHIAADKEFRGLTVDLGTLVPIYRVCRRCLAEDPIPYIRRSWRLTYSLVCDHHPLPLTDQCPICQYRFNYSGDRLRHHAKIDRTTVIRHCPRCAFNLAAQANTPLDPNLWRRLVQFQNTLHRIVTSGRIQHPRYGTISAASILQNYLTDEQTEGDHGTMRRFGGVDFRRCFGIHADQVLDAIGPRVGISPAKRRPTH